MPKVKIGDTEFELSILNYNGEMNDDDVNVRYAVCGDGIDIERSGKLLSMDEVEEIIYNLEDLLYDRKLKEEEDPFFGADLFFYYIPKKVEKIMTGCGHITRECRLKITVQLNYDYGEMWSITLDREHIEQLLFGLETEIGRRRGRTDMIRFVGVSFIGDWEDVHWYQTDESIATGQFVKVRHNGQTKEGLAELVRHYDSESLPPHDNGAVLEAVEDKVECSRLEKRWKRYGYVPAAEHTLKMIFDDGTKFTMIRNGGEYRLIVHNDIVYYDRTHLFCYGDIENITNGLGMLVSDNLEEVTVVGTADPDISFVLCPKGVKAIRDDGEAAYYKDMDGNIKEQFYQSNIMKIELDLCTDGVYGVQFWSIYLDEEETNNFATQWVTKICEK
ncbi:MAG: hypothetical protein NC184_00350 [Roseburia sp.]|nr:hypothetical protein [Roseburia sp.]